MKLIVTLIALLALVGCQTDTKVSEVDLNQENRAFSKISYGKDVELQRSIIVDVRSRFDHEMSRPPRSFHAHAPDWDLSDYSGLDLDNKVNELQRLLALNGVDPLTQVVILGYGMKGKGEEFLLASTLMGLGVKRINFLSEKQARKALTSRNLPKIENLDYWKRPLAFQMKCLEKQKTQSPEVLISNKVKGSNPGKLLVQQVFGKDLSVKNRRYPKSLRMRIVSPSTYWAYGLALHFKQQGRASCVL